MFGLLLMVGAVFALIAARTLLYPLALAVLFAYLIYPVAARLERWGWPRIPANLVSILVLMCVAGGVSYVLYMQFSAFADDVPDMQVQAWENIYELMYRIEGITGIPAADQRAWFDERVAGFGSGDGQQLRRFFFATTSTLVAVGLQPVYIFFLLYYRDKFRQFVMMVVPQHRQNDIAAALDDISLVTGRYMGGLFLVVSILCVLNSTGLYLIGIRYALLFGIVSALINLIPYFGTLAGGAVPLVFALLLEDSPHYAGYVALFFLVIQFVENNILTPNIVGGQVRINPLFIILSLIVGSLIWGLPGMFVAVPYLAMFKIICSYVPKLRPISYLIGTSGTERHELTWQKVARLWQRRPKEPSRAEPFTSQPHPVESPPVGAHPKEA
ncbi:MAG: AI-2E family transporter [Catalinimonas sp.]